MNGVDGVRDGDIGTVLAETRSPVAAVAIQLDRNGTIICIGRGGIEKAKTHFIPPLFNLRSCESGRFKNMITKTGLNGNDDPLSEVEY